MLEAGLVGHARLRYLGTSAQKARLVVDLIRGKQVEEALAVLRFTKKVVAREIGRTLDSAVANARLKKPEVDVDRLFVRTAFVDGGPSLKRVRPAPMGRAFRVQKRMCHVTLGVAEVPQFHPAAKGHAKEGAGKTPAAAPGAGKKSQRAEKKAAGHAGRGAEATPKPPKPRGSRQAPARTGQGKRNTGRG